MASNINPNNIDGTYPIAGQDNDSQGFRDNFTNIRSNFAWAEDEISDLQAKVVLKSALVGTALNNDMGGSILNNVQLQNVRETVVSNLPTYGTVTINYVAGSYQKIPTTTGTVTLAFNNFPAAGVLGRVRVQIDVSDVAHLLILPAAVTTGTNNLQGYNAATRTITFGQTGLYEFEFETSNGGSAITVFDLSRNADPIYLPRSEDLAASGAANLGITTSYFTTSGAETATLAAGYPGQVKVLAMYGDGGDMVVTVTNAGWKASGTGTITFDAIGDACTLMYINSKWFCIGNNGAVFG